MVPAEPSASTCEARRCTACKRGGDGFRAGLGMQVLLQSPEEIVDCGVGSELSLGRRCGQIADRPSWFFMIHSAGSPAAILVEKNAYWGKGSEPNARFIGPQRTRPFARLAQIPHGAKYAGSE
jgi:hypothetical protein